jgi:hypothetical protein
MVQQQIVKTLPSAICFNVLALRKYANGIKVDKKFKILLLEHSHFLITGYIKIYTQLGSNIFYLTKLRRDH